MRGLIADGIGVRVALVHVGRNDLAHCGHVHAGGDTARGIISSRVVVRALDGDGDGCRRGCLAIAYFDGRGIGEGRARAECLDLVTVRDGVGPTAIVCYRQGAMGAIGGH